jgi:hypothetical protein
MEKIGIKSLILGLLCCSAVYAQVPFLPESSGIAQSSFSAGAASFGPAEAFHLGGVYPFMWEGASFEPMFQTYFPLANQPVSTYLFFRKASYETDYVTLKWGRQRPVTFGQGLLLYNYDSGSGGVNTNLSTEKMGLLTHSTFANVNVDALVTARSLYAGRLNASFSDVISPDIPLVVGVTAVKDFAAVNGQSGVGIDLSLPVGGDFLVGFMEYANLANHGNGLGVGARGDLLGLAFYRVELRHITQGFIPGYFGATYERFPTAIFDDSVSSRLGGIITLGMLTEDGSRYGFQYERYGDKDALTLSTVLFPAAHVSTFINYVRPLQPGTSPLVVLAGHYHPEGSTIRWYTDVTLSDPGGANNRFYGIGMIYYFPQ